MKKSVILKKAIAMLSSIAMMLTFIDLPVFHQYAYAEGGTSSQEQSEIAQLEDVTDLHWVEGSSATVSWTAAPEANYYAVTVNIYDYDGTTLIGTRETGTTDDDLDVQQEIHNVIGGTNYDHVKVAVTVVAQKKQDDVVILQSMGVTTELWDYELKISLIKLPEATDLVLSEDGILSFSYSGDISRVSQFYPNAYLLYGNNSYKCYKGVSPNRCDYSNGRYSCNINDILEEEYTKCVNYGYFSNNEIVSVRCNMDVTPSKVEYYKSDYSDYSNSIDYSYNVTIFDIILPEPTDLVLSEDGILSFSYSGDISRVSAFYPNAYITYGNNTYKCYKGVSPRNCDYSNGRYSCDINDILEEEYTKCVNYGYFNNNETVSVRCNMDVTASSSLYVKSDYSDYSDFIEYTYSVSKFDIILPEPTELALSEEGILSFSYSGDISHVSQFYPNAYILYGNNSYKCYKGVSPRNCDYSNGRYSCDINDILKTEYYKCVSDNCFENGTVVNVKCNMDVTASSSQYEKSGFSDYSNTIDYSPIKTLTLAPSAPIVCKGRSYYLGKTIDPVDAYYEDIEWSSEDTSIVIVDENGMITGIAPGTANVTAAIGEVTATVPVTVYELQSNISDQEGLDEQDEQEIIDTAGGIIDDIANNDDPDLSNTDIDEDDIENIQEEIHNGMGQEYDFWVNFNWQGRGYGHYKEYWDKPEFWLWYDIQFGNHEGWHFCDGYNIEYEIGYTDNNNNDHHIGNITDFGNNEYEFCFEVPANLEKPGIGKKRLYKLVRYHDGQYEIVPVEVDDEGKMHGKSGKYSEFLLLYEDVDDETVEASGTCGENATWTLYSNGKLTISGTGAMYDFRYDSTLKKYTMPWYDDMANITSVEISKDITTIGEYAFAGCSSLNTVIFADGCKLTVIGKIAFFNCSIEALTIPASVTEIGEKAFSSCGSLKTVTFAEGSKLTTIGSNAFNCKSLTSITIPASVTEIGEKAFYYCSSLETLNFGENSKLTSIGDYAFYYCSKLSSVTIPASVTTIGDYAFYYCSKLSSVTIPASVTTIGEDAFNCCMALETVTFAEESKLTTIGKNAFSFCEALKTVTFAEDSKLTTIGTYAFCNCRSLSSITIPASVTSIGERAFNCCMALKTVIFVEDSKLTTIGASAFSNTSITYIMIPEGVTEISEGVFWGCALETFTFAEGVTKIGANAFRGCRSLTSITIPAGVTEIGEGVFRECYSLNTVTFAEESKLTKISNHAFHGCNLLRYVTIPASVTEIGEGAFSDCSWYLSSIIIPSGVTKIGANAFCGCPLKTLTIPASVTSIGEGAFSDCNYLSYVNMCVENPSNLTWVSDGGFKPNKVTICYVPDGMLAAYKEKFGSSINVTFEEHGKCGENAYWSFDNETGKLTISGTGAMRDYVRDSDSQYNDAPWYEIRKNIKSVEIENGITIIGSCAFSMCTSLASVTIPTSVTSIGERAFADCRSLKLVTFAEDSKLTTIGSSAFCWCSSLTSITIPASVTSIGEGAFYSCDFLSYVNMCVEKPSKLTWVSDGGFKPNKVTICYVPKGTLAAYKGKFGYSINVTFEEFGKCGENAYWSFDSETGKLTISGTGAMRYYIPYDGTGYSSEYANVAPWFDISDDIKSIEIENGITTIGGCPFGGCTSLTSITIPSSVTELGWEVFYNCTSLESINIPSSVTCIGGNAFYGCTAITDVYLCVEDTDDLTWSDYNCNDFKPDGSTKCHVPKGTVAAYKAKFSTDSLSTDVNVTFVADVTATVADGITHGTVAVDKTEALSGDEVTLTVTPSKGYKLKSLTVKDSSGNDVTVTDNKFTMPDLDVTVSAEFEPIDYTVKFNKNGGTGTMSNEAFKYGKAQALTANSFTRKGYTFAGWNTKADGTGNSYADQQSVKNLRATDGKTITLYAQWETAPHDKLEIVTQPQDAIDLKVGDTVNFSVTAKGEGLSYSWYYSDDGETFTKTSQTTSSYTIKMTERRNGRCMYCEIKDKYDDTVTTQTVKMLLQEPLVITTQPKDHIALNEQEKTNFKVEATGEGLKYAWYYADLKSDGTYGAFKKTSCTTPNYKIAVTASRHGRAMYCEITDKFGRSVRTDTVYMYLAGRLRITVQPGDSVVSEYGQYASFVVEAEGSDLTYRWYYSDLQEDGTYSALKETTATLDHYRIKVTSGRVGRRMYCRVTDKNGNSVLSEPAQIVYTPA